MMSMRIFFNCALDRKKILIDIITKLFTCWSLDGNTDERIFSMSCTADRSDVIVIVTVSDRPWLGWTSRRYTGWARRRGPWRRPSNRKTTRRTHLRPAARTSTNTATTTRNEVPMRRRCPWRSTVRGRVSPSGSPRPRSTAPLRSASWGSFTGSERRSESEKWCLSFFFDPIRFRLRFRRYKWTLSGRVHCATTTASTPIWL